MLARGRTLDDRLVEEDVDRSEATLAQRLVARPVGPLWSDVWEPDLLPRKHDVSYQITSVGW